MKIFDPEHESGNRNMGKCVLFHKSDKREHQVSKLQVLLIFAEIKKYRRFYLFSFYIGLKLNCTYGNTVPSPV